MRDFLVIKHEKATLLALDVCIGLSLVTAGVGFMLLASSSLAFAGGILIGISSILLVLIMVIASLGIPNA